MSTTLDKSLNDLIEAKVKEILDRRVEALVAEKLKKEKESRRKRLAIAVVSKGTIETAYAALILATTAAALDMEAGVYFSFFGLNILKKGNQDSLKVVPLGNPAMPVAMPNIVSVLPGMTSLATFMMKREIKKKKIATVPELMQIALETGVKLWPCQMAMEMFNLKKEDLIDGLPDPVGAATFLEYAGEADITLFI
ncbi:MAG TPA: DsrE/DsrF/DrsH-like family protein [Nitrospiria bacterium]|jgi:peroxiredoxin family protein|nr:DsrE/DsrF/DrsH-like family protein [Nitrospiria bacterium]